MTRKYTNPFILTAAQRELRDSVKTYKIWFHLLEYGDPVGDGFHSDHGRVDPPGHAKQV